MCRALIGYSTPIGYDYRLPAVADRAGRPKEANPILVGSMGLMLLYDELWFVEEWLCPASMRDLPYCHFLSKKRPQVVQSVSKIPEIDYSAECKFPDLNDLDREGYSGFMRGYYGADHPDNHSFSGNPTPENVARDIELVDRCCDLSFDLAMNDLTHQCLFPDRLEYLHSRTQFEMIKLAELALNVTSMYDIAGDSGPYHPVIEPMRESRFLMEFRDWASDKTTRLDNSSTDEIVDELDARVSEFTSGALSDAIGADGLKETVVDLAKDVALDLVPGAATIHTAIGLIGATKDRSNRRLSTFIADGRSSVHIAQRKANRKNRTARN